MKRRTYEVKGRERSLTKAQSLVDASLSVEIVGSLGSGRTAFLRALKHRLEEHDWVVFEVSGVASLKQTPFAALTLTDLVDLPPTGRMDSVIEEVGNQLTAAVTSDHSAFFVDDWDDLDEASWGVIEYVRRVTGIPIITSRLQGRRARHTPSGLPASTHAPAYVIDMLPLRFEDLQAAVSDHLGGYVDASTSRRIYAKSGGNIGLALSLVDATMREGRLVQLDGEVWTAVRELWSPSLRTVMEMHLESLDATARDALETIAMIGLADIETVRKLVEWPTLELLEERAMIAFVHGKPSSMVLVVPPLLVSYFRHEPLSARRIRLTERIDETLGTSIGTRDIESGWSAISTVAAERDALFAGMLRENARTLQLVAAYEWENASNVRTAINYIRVLSQTSVQSSSTVAERVFTQTDWMSGDIPTRAEFCCLRAQWLAYVKGEVDEAVEYLETHAQELSSYGRMLDAQRMSILADCRSVPQGFEAILEVTDDLPIAVQLSLLDAQLFVLTVSCRLRDAERVYEEIKVLNPQNDDYRVRVLHGLGQLAMGNFERGQRELENGLDEARGALHLEAFRAFAGAVAYAHVHSGDIQGLSDLLDVALSTGELSPLPAGSRTSILMAAALLAASRGQVGLCERYAAILSSEPGSECALPGQTAAWVEAQLAIINGCPEQGADMLWEASAALADRGALYAAQLGMLASIEIHYDAQRLERARELLDTTPDSVVLRAQADYLSALAEDDAQGVFDAGVAFESYYRIGLALAAYERSAQLAATQKLAALHDRARDYERRLRASQGARAFNTTRFGAIGSSLSRREKEVASLAVTGLSNHEIAKRLVLSVRTVESHMHRIMRKLGVSNREALASRIADGNYLQV